MFTTLCLPRLLAAAVLAASCSDDSPNPGLAQPAPARGDLLALTPLGSLAPADVASYVAEFEIDSGAIRYGVDAYRVEYRTIDPDGELVRASSLLALPSRAE